LQAQELGFNVKEKRERKQQGSRLSPFFELKRSATTHTKRDICSNLSTKALNHTPNDSLCGSLLNDRHKEGAKKSW
jgi:hypothetical protein